MKTKTRKRRYNEIIAATERNSNACVIELAESYLKDYPNSQGAWDMYSLALYRVDRFKDAKKAVLKAIEFLDETNKQKRTSWLYHRLGHIYENSGNFSKAFEWYEKAHFVNPQEATFLIYQGIMRLRKERFADAAALFERATKCEKGCIHEAFYNLGVAHLIQRNYAKAKSCFENALKIDPKYKIAKQQLKDVNQVLEMFSHK